jgi:hypothetical protein
MSPCFQADPGDGFTPGQNGYQSQEECEANCSQTGACCDNGSCSQQKKCDCKAEDGKIFFGVGSECEDTPCPCEAISSDCDWDEYRTIKVSLHGLVDTNTDKPRSCTLKPASELNDKEICFTREPTFSDGLRDYFVGQGCSAANGLFFASLILCRTGDYIQATLELADWPALFVFRVHGVFGFSCEFDEQFALSSENLFGTQPYGFDSGAYCRIWVADCEPPNANTCCFYCSDFGGTKLGLKQTIDVTISDVVGNYYFGNQSSLNGTYTLQRTGCGYYFSQSAAPFGDRPRSIYIEPRSCALYGGTFDQGFGQQSRISGYKWIASVFATNVYGYTAGFVFGIGSTVHSVPACCAADELEPESYNDGTIDPNFPPERRNSLTLEIHCD